MERSKRVYGNMYTKHLDVCTQLDRKHVAKLRFRSAVLEHCWELPLYRGTSPIRNAHPIRTPLGP